MRCFLHNFSPLSDMTLGVPGIRALPFGFLSGSAQQLPPTLHGHLRQLLQQSLWLPPLYSPDLRTQTPKETSLHDLAALQLCTQDRHLSTYTQDHNPSFHFPA